MKYFCSLFFCIFLALAPAASFAEKDIKQSINEAMATLKDAYAHTYRYGKPTSIPASIEQQHQSLIDDSTATETELNDFLNEIQKQINYFNRAKEISRGLDATYDRLERCLLIDFGMRLNLDNFQAFVEEYNAITKNDYLGFDIFMHEVKYNKAFSQFRDDVLATCEARVTLSRITRDSSYSKLSPQNKNRVASEREQVITIRDEAYELAKQSQWKLAAAKYEQGIKIARTLEQKITALAEEQRQADVANIERYKRLASELESLKPQIERTKEEYELYREDVEQTCDVTEVDYDCANQCPDVRKWDIIIQSYKYESDYRCLSRCNDEEQEKQAWFDRQEAPCLKQQKRAYTKSKKLYSEHEKLIDRYNQKLQDLRDLQAIFNQQ